MFYETILSQIFENIQSNQTIHCGLANNNCTIICQTHNSCQSSTFYLHNNNALLLCSGLQSCESLKIFGINATSLSIKINGTQAFQFSIVMIHSSVENTIIHCSGLEACTNSSFYYKNTGNVTHSCENNACHRSLISSLQSKMIQLRCGSSINDISCSEMDFYVPINSSYTSVINILGIPQSFHIYSIHGFGNLQIICSDRSDYYGIHADIYLIFGKSYQSIHSIDDSMCMDKSLNISDDQNIEIIFYDKHKPNFNLTGDNVLLFILYDDASSILDIQSDQTIDLYIICVDTIYFSTCNNLLFDLSAIQNTTVIANNADSIS